MVEEEEEEEEYEEAVEEVELQLETDKCRQQDHNTYL